MYRRNRYYDEDSDDDDAGRFTVVPWQGDDDTDEEDEKPNRPPHWVRRPELSSRAGRKTSPAKEQGDSTEAPAVAEEEEERETYDDEELDGGGSNNNTNEGSYGRVDLEEIQAGIMKQLNLEPADADATMHKNSKGGRSRGQAEVVVIKNIHLNMQGNKFENFAFNKTDRVRKH